MPLPARFAAVVLTLTAVFLQPWTRRHAELLPVGATLAPGKRAVTSLSRIAGLLAAGGARTPALRRRAKEV